MQGLSGAQLLLLKTLGIQPEHLAELMRVAPLFAQSIDNTNNLLPAIAKAIASFDGRLAAIERRLAVGGDDGLYPAGAPGAGSAAGDGGGNRSEDDATGNRDSDAAEAA